MSTAIILFPSIGNQLEREKRNQTTEKDQKGKQ